MVDTLPAALVGLLLVAALSGAALALGISSLLALVRECRAAAARLRDLEERLHAAHLVQTKRLYRESWADESTNLAQIALRASAVMSEIREARDRLTRHLDDLNTIADLASLDKLRKGDRHD